MEAGGYERIEQSRNSVIESLRIKSMKLLNY